MQNKVKVLFVVSEFYQAGTQRFTYELDRSLNKEKFSVEILCLLPLNSSNRFTDYYYLKHLELGTKIHFIDEINQLTVPTFSQKIKKRLFRTPYADERIRIRSFFDEFDSISVMGEYNFKEIYKYLTPENRRKLLIHIQNSKYQVKQAYASFPKEEVFHFVSGTNESMLKCNHRTLLENSRTPLGHNHPILLLFMTSAALVELEALYCRGLFKLLHRLTWIV